MGGEGWVDVSGKCGWERRVSWAGTGKVLRSGRKGGPGRRCCADTGVSGAEQVIRL